MTPQQGHATRFRWRRNPHVDVDGPVFHPYFVSSCFAKDGRTCGTYLDLNQAAFFILSSAVLFRRVLVASRFPRDPVLLVSTYALSKIRYQV